MAKVDRKTEYFHGCRLVAATLKGDCKGRAYHWFANRLETSGHASIEDVLATFKHDARHWGRLDSMRSSSNRLRPGG
jgi:hypothetical protein